MSIYDYLIYFWQKNEYDQCSLNAVSVLLNDNSNRGSPYHFPVYNINDQPSNVAIVRNLPPYFNLESADGNTLQTMIENVSTVVSINQAMSNYQRYAVVRVTLNSSEDARRLAERITSVEFHRKYLTVL